MIREKAIKILRDIHDKSLISVKEALETFIPELAESEDERIINQLINLVNSTGEILLIPTNKEELISWLEKQKKQDKCPEYCIRSHCMGCSIYEKQKEQIPYIDFVIKPHKGDDNNPYDMRVSEAQEYAIKRGFGIPFNDGEVYVDERHMTQTIGNILRWADEHPLEQKSWEWSEEDECHLASIIGCIELCNKDTEDAASVLGYYDSDIAWLKSLRPQPKQEWGEEDEAIRIEAIKLLSNPSLYEVCEHLREESVDWLKTLHTKVNVNSEKVSANSEKVNVNWSEEDEKDMAHIIRILNDCCAYGKHDLSKTDHENLVNKLKSLRPSWKPTGEQMEALFEAMQETRPGWLFNRQLVSLYDDLKKLI